MSRQLFLGITPGPNGAVALTNADGVVVLLVDIPNDLGGVLRLITPHRKHIRCAAIAGQPARSGVGYRADCCAALAEMDIPCAAIPKKELLKASAPAQFRYRHPRTPANCIEWRSRHMALMLADRASLDFAASAAQHRLKSQTNGELQHETA